MVCQIHTVLTLLGTYRHPTSQYRPKCALPLKPWSSSRDTKPSEKYKYNKKTPTVPMLYQTHHSDTSWHTYTLAFQDHPTYALPLESSPHVPFLPSPGWVLGIPEKEKYNWKVPVTPMQSQAHYSDTSWLTGDCSNKLQVSNQNVTSIRSVRWKLGRWERTNKKRESLSWIISLGVGSWH